MVTIVMMLAVMPALASAIPAPPGPSAALTLPSNWIKSYQTTSGVDAYDPSTDGNNAAWFEYPKDGSEPRLVFFDGSTKTRKSWNVGDSGGWSTSLSGNKIAFTSDYNICMVDITTGEFTEVTDERTSRDPCISNGKLVYMEFGSRPHQLRVYDIATGADTVLVSIPGVDASSPAISGDKVVFTAYAAPDSGPAGAEVPSRIAPAFQPGYSVGYVSLSGGAACQIGKASRQGVQLPAIWGSRAFWLDRPIDDPTLFDPQMYDFGTSILAPFSFSPSAVGFVSVHGDAIAWMSGNSVVDTSISSPRQLPTKPKVGPQSIAPANSGQGDQLNWRNMATGEQQTFMTNAQLQGFAVGSDLLSWSYHDMDTNRDVVIVAQYVQPKPQYVQPKPPLQLGTPNAPWKVRRNRFIDIWGALSPAHRTGTKWIQLSFERWVGKRYRHQKTETATSYSTGSPSEHYGLRTKLTRSGRWRVSAFHPADADGPDMWSGYENMLVR